MKHKALVPQSPLQNWTRRLDSQLDRFETYRLLRYFVRRGKAEAAKAGLVPWPDRNLSRSVAASDTRQNIRNMVERIRDVGADPIVLDLELGRGWSSDEVTMAATVTQAPLLDVRRLFRRRIQAAAPRSRSRADPGLLRRRENLRYSSVSARPTAFAPPSKLESCRSFEAPISYWSLPRWVGDNAFLSMTTEEAATRWPGTASGRNATERL